MSRDFETYPWLQLPSETDEQHELFNFYLRLGCARSFTLVLDSVDRRISMTEVLRLARDYSWQERARAYDLYQARCRAADDEAQRLQAKRDKAEIYALARGPAKASLRAMTQIMLDPLIAPRDKIAASKHLLAILEKFSVDTFLADDALSEADRLLILGWQRRGQELEQLDD